VAVTDYGGFYGVHESLATIAAVPAETTGQAGTGRGLIYKVDETSRAKLRLSAISDGLSNTLYITESAGRPTWIVSQSPQALPLGYAINGGGWCRPASDLGLLRGTNDAGTEFSGSRPLNVTNGIPFRISDYGNAGLGAAYGPFSYFGTDGTGQVYAFHTGGVNCLNGDGSVRFVPDTVSIRNFAAYVTRDGGEPGIMD
jgi:hypothetical protein